MAPFSHLEAFGGFVNQTNDWTQVISEMIGLSGDKPIPGAKARVAIERIAQEKGLSFPPAEMAGKKFYDYLENFPSIISLRKRLHQDFLIAPADRPELLASMPTKRGKSPQLRSDLYQALTKERLSKEKPFYDVG
ncbi:hypothetical protein K6979_14245 [Xanthomonas cucurbitae]|uniref:hypothetical protein n=1 Tax=Xanthomonas cucurbitae TaxID=56453 RepID=UPI00236783F2|nr:hypothetical protein [Xanthomonas cucurbitae]WDM78320.1 hypothetical protein K6980_14240 [Xanthomonas cucurbitae]WDM82000.1 hypothetical protein K6979_14245 [Xanthomonas cucurbitae]